MRTGLSPLSRGTGWLSGTRLYIGPNGTLKIHPRPRGVSAVKVPFLTALSSSESCCAWGGRRRAGRSLGAGGKREAVAPGLGFEVLSSVPALTSLGAHSDVAPASPCLPRCLCLHRATRLGAAGRPRRVCVSPGVSLTRGDH